MSALIDDLLYFSRFSHVELTRESVNLNALVESVIGDNETETTGRNVVWKRTPLPRVWGDRSLLRQVLVNLVSNALKYSRKSDPAEIEIGVQESGPQETVLFVRDNGAGFDSRYAGKLFGVFQRMHKASEFEGTGIGLASVRRIIARHGGKTWAEGKVGQGATFYFSLATAPTNPVSPVRKS
jgi:light-regulated signal transduction histidine kinase (bacteriophytochrome)